MIGKTEFVGVLWFLACAGGATGGPDGAPEGDDGVAVEEARADSGSDEQGPADAVEGAAPARDDGSLGIEDATADAMADEAPDDAPDDHPATKDSPTQDLGPDAFPPPVPVGCVTSVAAGEQDVPCDGIVFTVSVPEQCLTRACGLIVDIHGLTCSADVQDKNTNLRALGREHGFLVVQPNANPPPPLSSWNQGTDDEKIRAFMADVIAAWHVDPDRVHVTGFSQGGFMTWRFICRYAEVLASAAPAAGCSDYGGVKGCAFLGNEVSAVEVPILYLHGHRDGLIAFSCAERQRDAVVAAWGLALVEEVSSDAGHTWSRYINPNGTVFEFIEHDWEASSDFLKGHCIPGSHDLKPTEPGQLFGYACVGETAVNWGEAVVRFFLDHPRRQYGE